MAVDPGTLTSFDLNDTTPITTNTGAVVLTLTAESFFPQGSVGGTPTVSSSDTSIATVSASAFVLNSDSTAVISDITITGVAIGTSTITVSFTDPGTVAHSVTATVTVEAPDYLDQSGLRHFWDKIKSLFIKNENGAITTDLLANSAVTTAKINASAITNAKLATAAVQTTNILDGAVTSGKIDWATLPYAKVEWKGSYEISQTEASIYALDVSSMPTGAVFMIAACTNASGSQTQTGMFTRLQHGSTYGTYTGSVTAWGKFSTVIACFTKQSGIGTVDLRAYKDNTTSVNVNTISIMAWRVG